MLDPWIIEQIRRREEEERRRREEQPVLEIPLDRPGPTGREEAPRKDERGIEIIDYRI